MMVCCNVQVSFTCTCTGVYAVLRWWSRHMVKHNVVGLQTHEERGKKKANEREQHTEENNTAKRNARHASW